MFKSSLYQYRGPIKVTNAGLPLVHLLNPLHQLFPHLQINGIKDSLWKEINCILQIAFKEFLKVSLASTFRYPI